MGEVRLRSGYFSVFIRVSEGRGGCVRSLALWREGEWRPGRTGLPELYSFSRYDPAAEVAPGSRIPPADIVEIDLTLGPKDHHRGRDIMLKRSHGVPTKVSVENRYGGFSG